MQNGCSCGSGEAESNGRVCLDVGGRLFHTTVSTLNTYPDSLLAKLCKHCPDAVGGEKPVKIERDPNGFEWILQLYRRHPCPWTVKLPDGFNLDEIRDILTFYQLPSPHSLRLPCRADWIRQERRELIDSVTDKILSELQDKPPCFRSSVGFFLFWEGGELFVDSVDGLMQVHLFAFSREHPKAHVTNALKHMFRNLDEFEVIRPQGDALMMSHSRMGCWTFANIDQGCLNMITSRLWEYGDYTVTRENVSVDLGVQIHGLQLMSVTIPFLVVSW